MQYEKLVPPCFNDSQDIFNLEGYKEALSPLLGHELQRAQVVVTNSITTQPTCHLQECSDRRRLALISQKLKMHQFEHLSLA